MKIILLFKFKLCDKNQWWIWHKTATKYTYNDDTRHSAKETRPFIQEEHSDCHQKLTMAKGEQSSKPVVLQLPEKLLRTPHQPLNRFEAERENSLRTRWKSTHSSLWPPSSYTKSLLLVKTVVCDLQLSHWTKRLQSIPQRQTCTRNKLQSGLMVCSTTVFWTLAKHYLRSVLRKLTRYRTTQRLWLALVKRKS